MTETYEALQASRGRVVEKADAERRRIERGLHDGVQQHLIALAVSLQLLHQLVDTDPEAAKAMAEELRRDVHDALESVRTLAQSVYPPLLLDYGVGEALRGAAATLPVRTQVEAEFAERYDPDVEAAVYFACLAALADAPDGEATVRARAEDGRVLFEVLVDRGPSEATRSELDDRVGAAGGSVEIETQSGRTRISGSIPYRSSAR